MNRHCTRVSTVALVAALAGCTSILGLDLERYHEASSHGPGSTDADGAVGSPLPEEGSTSATPAERRLAVAKDHLCAINAAGGLYCLGSNEAGALGRGTLGGSTRTFERVPLPAAATAVAAGDRVSCAVAGEGLYCWGDVSFNSMAIAAPTLRGNGAFRWVAIADTGFHGCAGTRSGAVRCWGRNDSGELGTTQYDPAGPLFDVESLSSGATSGAAGLSFSCVVRTGTTFCFGNNAIGQCGVLTSVAQLNFWQAKPVGFMPAETHVADVTAGRDFACARTAGGIVLCWGGDDVGQLGAAATDKTKGMPVPYLATPVAIGGLDGPARMISAGRAHACALMENGALNCWGDNARGQLARDAATTFSDLPQAVEAAGEGIIAVDAEGDRTCILRQGSEVVCWGESFGAPDEAGAPGDTHVPQLVGALPME